MESKFKKIIVIGSGQLASQCAQLSKTYLDDVSVLELKVTNSTILEKQCEKAQISYRSIDKYAITQSLQQEEVQTLVVSAGNTFLFPHSIITKPNLYIMNWHNALLPHHRGRNAEVWAIYYGETKTGVTWHQVVEDVDAGDILCQRELPIEDKMTAISLYRKQCELGFEMFAEIIEPVLEGKCVAKPQEPIAQEEIHYSREIPNQGVLSLEWSMRQISCFLRAMDYGRLLLLGKTYVEYQKKRYSFYRYKIGQAEEFATQRKIELSDDKLMIQEGSTQIVLRDLQEELGWIF